MGPMTPIQTLSSQHLRTGFKITAFQVLFYKMDIMITSKMLKVLTSVSEIQDIFEGRNHVFFKTYSQAGIMSFSAMRLHSLKP